MCFTAVIYSTLCSVIIYFLNIFLDFNKVLKPAQFSRYSDSLRTGWSGVRIREGAGDFVFSKMPRPVLWLTLGSGVRSGELKRTGRHVANSPPSSVQVKNQWRFISTPPLSPHTVHRNIYTFFTTAMAYSTITRFAVSLLLFSRIFNSDHCTTEIH